MKNGDEQSGLEMLRIDSRRDDVDAAISELRKRLSPRGEVVSEEGRRRTIEIFGEPLAPSDVVQRICEAVRGQGMAALLDYSARIDGAQLTSKTLRVPHADLEAAHREADAEFLETVRRIRDNIFEYQRAILHRAVHLSRPDGGFLGERYVPLERVGICVPGGAAAYPSTVLMTAVPAQAAGVQEIAVVAPPTPLGAYNGAVLAVCHELGITEVYRMGGAQAVAALAYGVEGIRPVDKIVGPGNLFVALAKQQVFGDVDIDSIAGPSEVVVLADETAQVDHVAADLIAQAEHSPGSSVLITWSESLWSQLPDALAVQLKRLARGDLAAQSLAEFGALILVADENEAIRLSNAIAPEHLHIAVDHAERLLPQVVHAGAVFLGHYSPVALGDYVAGPSHVLPTGGTARFASGLSANDFLRHSSVICFSRESLAKVRADVALIAEIEGLTAHRASVDIRLRPEEDAT